MSDMNVNHAPAVSPVSSAPAQSGGTLVVSTAAKGPSKDVLDLSDIGLGRITRYNNDSPLAAQIKGYGSVSVERNNSQTSKFGNMTQRFSVHCDWTYVDLVNHTITRTVSHGEGLNYSDCESGTRVTAFAGVTASVTFSAERYFRGQLDDVAGAAAASREVMAQQLKNTLHGSELEQGLSKLEDIYSKSREQAENSFADMLAQFADRDSKSEIIDRARQSVRSLFTAYEERCRAIYAGGKLDGEGGDLYAMAAQLRRLSAAAVHSGKTEKGIYSLSELDFAAVSVSAFRSLISAAAQGGGGSEARQAVSLSFTAMKIEAVSARGLMGGMSAFLRAGVHSAREQLLRAMDGYLASRREKGGSEDEYPAADGALFDGVYNRVMDAFAMTGDAMSSLREGVQEARGLLRASARLTAVRFSAEVSVGGYWDSFDGRDYRAGIYGYARQWESFTAELQSGSVKARA